MREYPTPNVGAPIRLALNAMLDGYCEEYCGRPFAELTAEDRHIVLTRVSSEVGGRLHKVSNILWPRRKPVRR